jgi:purine nucleoside permease
MSFICGYHKTRVVVFVCNVNIRTVICQVLDNVQTTVETRRSQGGRVGLGRVVHVRTRFYQSFHYIKVT